MLPKIIKAETISDFEYKEDEMTIGSRHGIRRALVGGALTFWNPVGAIVGGTTGKTITRPYVTSADIIITTTEPKIYKARVIKKKAKTASHAYKKSHDKVKLALIELAKAIDVKQPSQNATVSSVESNIVTNDSDAATSLDPTVELRKYKQLLDDGIINEEEFSAKKKQLLNL